MATHSRVMVLMLDSFSSHQVLLVLLRPWHTARTLGTGTAQAASK
jgi:hypothetical protein